MTETDQAEPQLVQEKVGLDQKQERTWAMFCHLGALAGYFFPFGNIIAPLIIWQIKKNESELVNDQGKESVNFQISIAIYVAISIALMIVVIGVLLLPAVCIFNAVMVIIAGLKANEGQRYRYPVCIRFIK
ncbi:MAG: DUF4870 domain-containing protein [Actinobacteria bacterium]|nr:DUF4870 domain-containing protein [Actinomycetota bacterium]